MDFVWQDMIFELILKHHNGVVSERAADKCAHGSWSKVCKNAIIFLLPETGKNNALKRKNLVMISCDLGCQCAVNENLRRFLGVFHCT